MNKQDVIDLIKDSGFGFLASVDGNQPRVRPLMPYLTEDGKMFFARFTNCRTFKQIKENPLVEMSFVDRKMAYCRLTGKATIIENATDQKELLWNNLPILRQFYSGPEDKNFAVMEMEIKSVEAMTPSQQEPEIIDFT